MRAVQTLQTNDDRAVGQMTVVWRHNILLQIFLCKQGLSMHGDQSSRIIMLHPVRAGDRNHGPHIETLTLTTSADLIGGQWLSLSQELDITVDPLAIVTLLRKSVDESDDNVAGELTIESAKYSVCIYASSWRLRVFSIHLMHPTTVDCRRVMA
jgi:hypothetical protein